MTDRTPEVGFDSGRAGEPLDDNALLPDDLDEDTVTGTRNEPTPQPGPLRRLAVIARFPLGIAIVATRYLWWAREYDHQHPSDGAAELPPALPDALMDARVKTLDDGAGPLFHRTFAVRVRDTELDAAGLMAHVTTDLDRAAPSEVVSFRKVRGRLGELVVGDEYRVRMPAPWDGPVRVVHRDPTSFRFVTLAGHLEAGQIEFRARDVDGGLQFEIETWSRPGDLVAAFVFDQLKVGKEIQLTMWAEFCMAIPRLAGGRRAGPVDIETRRLPWPPPDAGEENVPGRASG